MNSVTASPAPVKSAATRPATRKPARKAPARRCNCRGNVLTITVGEGEKARTDRYAVEPLPCDHGRAFRVLKLTDDRGDAVPYDVFLSRLADSCECLGFLRHRHCRHVEALRALLAAGRLPVAPAAPAPAPTPDRSRWARME